MNDDENRKKFSFLNIPNSQYDNLIKHGYQIHLVVLGLEVSRGSLLSGLSSLVTLTILVSGTSLGTATNLLGTSSLLVGSGNNTAGKTQPVSEVLNTRVGESVVVVLPRESGLGVTLGGQGLESLDNVEVSSINISVVDVVVLLSNNNALCKKKN